jgi:SAM-dependent methyltransferase
MHSMDSAGWDARYESAELVWGAGPNLFLPPLVEDLAGGRALDLACGEGRNAIWLARNGWHVTAIDFSAVGIEKAKTLAGDTDVEWIVDDVRTFRPARVFDLVLIFYLHLSQEDLAAAFDGAVGAVAPGGTLFAVGHALRNLTDGYGGPPYPEILWTKESIAPLVEGLEVIELGERSRYVLAADETAIDLVVHATRRRG